MTATVTTKRPTTRPVAKVRTERKPAATSAKRHTPRTTRINRRYAAASAIAASALTAMSLTHLSSGIASVMHAPTWQAVVTASAIDLGFIVAELALVSVDERTLGEIKAYAYPIVYGSLIASAAFNVMAFTEGKSGLAMLPGILAGCAVPAAIYAFSRLAAKLWR